MGTRTLWIVIGLWMSAALAFAATVSLESMPRPLIPLMVWGPVIATLLLRRGNDGARDAIASVPLAVLVGFHIVRAPIGVAFLFYSGEGLHPDFAVPGGIGDIIAGALAIPAMFAAMSPTGRKRLVVLAWNALALADIIMVFASAQRILFFGSGFDEMSAFGSFPFPAIPAFVVPIVVVTHVLIFLRLRSPRDTVEAWPQTS
jgi:hypothetical protein